MWIVLWVIASIVLLIEIINQETSSWLLFVWFFALVFCFNAVINQVMKFFKCTEWYWRGTPIAQLPGACVPVGIKLLTGLDDNKIMNSLYKFKAYQPHLGTNVARVWPALHDIDIDITEVHALTVRDWLRDNQKGSFLVITMALTRDGLSCGHATAVHNGAVYNNYGADNKDDFYDCVVVCAWRLNPKDVKGYVKNTPQLLQKLKQRRLFLDRKEVLTKSV